MDTEEKGGGEGGGRRGGREGVRKGRGEGGGGGGERGGKDLEKLSSDLRGFQGLSMSVLLSLSH